MLKTLTVQNFALIEKVEIEFGENLNILTGETGAGKSILIDALGAVLGGRIGTGMIRTGCQNLKVEAVFAVDDQNPAVAFLKEADIDSDDGEIIIMRQLSINGKSSVTVNGAHVTVTNLRKLGALLVDIHGQNENLALLRESRQYELVDGGNGNTALNDYKAAYQAFLAAKNALAEKEAGRKNYAERAELLSWQLKEINDADLTPDEDKTLSRTIHRLSHAEKIADYVGSSVELLDVGVRGSLSVLAALTVVERNLEDMARFDNTLTDAQKIIEEARINIQEATYDIKEYADNIDFDPESLNKAQQRMDLIDRLCRKYGQDVAAVLSYRDKIAAELNDTENIDADIDKLRLAIAEQEKKLASAADKLTATRQKRAKDLALSVESRLNALGMKNARFVVDILPATDYGNRGKDEIVVNFSANAGEELKPLKDVASGGELSRIALAVKAQGIDTGGANTLVFDEIDTGIGGATAKMVAECIAMVARGKQVLCITHLPQIAAAADVHLYIEKESDGHKTVTQVKNLSLKERVGEIARMTSGTDETAAAINNAEEMLKTAATMKENLA